MKKVIKCKCGENLTLKSNQTGKWFECMACRKVYDYGDIFTRTQKKG